MVAELRHARVRRRPLGRRRVLVGTPPPADFARRYGAARGLYRVFGPAVYRFFRSSAGPPDPNDTPFATAPSLPATPGAGFADGTWWLSVSLFNGIVDSGFAAIGPAGETFTKLVVSSGGAGAVPPRAPFGATLQLRAGGVVRVIATYAETGPNRGDTWAIAYTTDGSDPAPGAPNATETFDDAEDAQVLRHDLPAQADGTRVKVLVQVRRVAVYSGASGIVSAIADATGPARIPGGTVWRGALPEGTA